ncbi:unnamed protein product [Callosobruchus maculatus]|uniref:Uncharacterized protein n=1 Tax=Callosobruchus maculatus TaxID=64391 RepID=A0A653BR89_CALMS|nr:unnamed protein product [Callosobruchus maculatus]
MIKIKKMTHRETHKQQCWPPKRRSSVEGGRKGGQRESSILTDWRIWIKRKILTQKTVMNL